MFATPKARAVFKKMTPTGEIEEVFPGSGESIALMADGSPCFIHEKGPYRVVLCVAHGKKHEHGVFAVINVERRYRK